MSNDYMHLAEFFKVFGDNTRLKIIKSIETGEKSVGDIARTVGLAQSAVSHQLRLLRDKRLVSIRKSGKSVYYTLNDEHIREIFRLGMDHMNERTKRRVP